MGSLGRISSGLSNILARGQAASREGRDVMWRIPFRRRCGVGRRGLVAREESEAHATS